MLTPVFFARMACLVAAALPTRHHRKPSDKKLVAMASGCQLAAKAKCRSSAAHGIRLQATSNAHQFRVGWRVDVVGFHCLADIVWYGDERLVCDQIACKGSVNSKVTFQ